MYVDPQVLYGVGLLSFGALMGLCAMILLFFQTRRNVVGLEHDVDNIVVYLTAHQQGVWPPPLVTDLHSLDASGDRDEIVGDMGKEIVQDPESSSPMDLPNSLYWT